jgi:hypothetical protein
MPYFAAAIVTALGWAMKFLIARALLALGLQLAVVVGLDALMDYAISQALNNISALDPVVYSVVIRARIPDAIAVISAAALVKHSLTYGAAKLMLVGRQVQP